MNSKPVILIIEDNDFVSRMYANILHLEHYEVKVAQSGEEGIRLAHELGPQLIFLDVIMPKMNGIEVLKELKSDPLTSQIPIVMLTVVGEDDVIDEAFKLGASGYLLKPSLNPDQILAEVRTYLKKDAK